MIRRYSLVWSLFLLIGVMGGCQAILQFDEDKLDTGSGGKSTTSSQGGAGNGGTATTTQGGNGGTATTTSQGGNQGGGGQGGGGQGGTGGCAVPSDCPDPGSECLQNTCEGGVCGTAPVQPGEPATKQTTGDCKIAICDGSGGITTENDDGDPLDDGLDCTEDVCAAGAPATNAVTAGMPCDDGGGKLCNGLGACVQCLVDADCGPGAPKCSGQVCVPANCDDGVKNGDETDTDCGGSCGASCGTGDACGVAADCASGVCTAMACAPPACDDGVKNGNETDADCGGADCQKCGPLKGCDVNADCAGNQCTGAGGTCVPNCSDGVKNNAETGVDCGGTCAGCGAGGPCAQDTDCVATAYCAGMTCVAKKANGQACAAGNQCASGACADGVCCNSACGGTCQACNLAGSSGTCTPIPIGQDPIDECAGAQVCDGAGACKKGLGQTCAASVECAQGNCADGVCCNTACGGVCQACNLAGSVGSCTNIPAGQDPANECAGSVNCNGNGACGSLLGNGQACSLGSECQSTNCVDGVCCDTACGALCQACNLTGTIGTCTSIPSGQDPANECANGACGGAGTCKSDNGQTCAAASACLSNTCVDGVCCNTACGALCQACNLAGSMGTCSSIANGQDPANECAGATNCNGSGACTTLAQGAACTQNAECASGNCVDGVCCNTACGGLCQACNLAGSIGTCSNIAAGQDPANECANGACGGAGTCKSDNGQTCAAASACLSNNCVDGVCCNATCGALCQACNLTGSVGTCSNIANGQDPANECAGTTSCNGSGACATLALGAACTLNAECTSGICVDGRCCNATCGGLCQACNLTGNLGTCTSIPSGQDPANECVGATTCNGSGLCNTLSNGASCTVNAECGSGLCVDGVCCNAACGALCQACNLAGSAGTCTNIPSGQDPADECAGSQVCNGSGLCRKVNGDTCAANGECLSGSCVDGVCCNTACGALCQACNLAGSVGTCTNIPSGQDPANECVGATACNGSGACASLPNGTACGASAECASGNCVDGVCCNAACGGLCQACNLAGSVGTCSNIASGQDPANECAGTQVCNGSGQCRKANGDTCAASSECLSGSCADGVCCNTACGALCQACNLTGSVGTCSNIASGQDPANECAGATACNGSGACTTLPNGTACSASAECTSGSCVDGVCCNTACGALCQACNVSGSVGTCANIPSGQDPANECANGACGGAGTCKSDNGQNCAAAGTCLSNNCVDGVCCNNACNSTCQACNLSGNNGTCTNIPFGQDPANECVGLTFCSGSGTCSQLGLGSVCSQNAECASGFCVDGVCCNTGCSGTCQACNVSGSGGTCTNIPANTDPANECPGAQVCNGSGVCVKLPNGQPCSTATDCQSAFCVDGVCCNTACNQLCRSCNSVFAVGEVGTCSVIECADPDNECSGNSLCQINGSCGPICL